MDNDPPLLSESKWRPPEKKNNTERGEVTTLTVKAGAFHRELSSYYELYNGSAFDDTGLAPSNANGASMDGYGVQGSNRKLQSSVNRTSELYLKSLIVDLGEVAVWHAACSQHQRRSFIEISVHGKAGSVPAVLRPHEVIVQLFHPQLMPLVIGQGHNDV